ncbi:MAG: hypothetical protein ACKVIS_06660 [Pseudomonadales bacterium]
MSNHDEVCRAHTKKKRPLINTNETAAELAKIFIGQASTYQLEGLLGMYNLEQPSQVTMYIGLIAATYRIALLEAENRSLRIMAGNPAADDSIKLFPEVNTFMDAMNSDLRQVQATGRMPNLMHFEQRVRNAETRSKIADAGRALEIEIVGFVAAKAADGHSASIQFKE